MDRVEVGDLLYYFVNGDQSGQIYKERITESNIEMFNTLIEEGSIEVFDIR